MEKKSTTIGAPTAKVIIKGLPEKPKEEPKEKPKYPPGQSSVKINPGCRIR